MPMYLNRIDGGGCGRQAAKINCPLLLPISISNKIGCQIKSGFFYNRHFGRFLSSQATNELSISYQMFPLPFRPIVVVVVVPNTD